jgi:diguanylate cyclase (GGDEF)-like protein
MPEVNLIPGGTTTGRAIVRIGFPWWLRLLTFRETIAITLGRRIYIDSPERTVEYERLLDHELVHVRQAGELGNLVFWSRYVAEYFRNRWRGLDHDSAYRAISFEAEAFAAERVRPYNRGFTQTEMIQFHALEIPQLERFLERQKAGLSRKTDIDLDLVLRQILQKANEFVPSESGSILLDDPFRKVSSRRENELVFIATFGQSSRNLIGQRLSAKFGIVGQVYQTGTPYVSADVKEDDFFYAEFDQQLGHKTHSVVCVPIYIGKTVCGVLELINRLEGSIFTERDKTLLEIFAGYTSFTLQNALDAKRAHELAKKDDLTGLYNDRWFNVRLHESLGEARRTGKEAVLIFMDLDRFKAINDCHGHLAGSQVLREVGFLLKRVVPQVEATVARYGGDEFVILLPETTLDEGMAVCEEIRQTIEQTTFLEREWGFSMQPLQLYGVLSASLGIAQHVPDPGVPRSLEEEQTDLLRRADSAMYRAKSLGKNQVVVSRVGQELQSASEASSV